MVLAITFPGQLLYHSLFDFFFFFILLLLVVVLLPSLLWLVGLVGAEVFSLWFRLLVWGTRVFRGLDRGIMLSFMRRVTQESCPHCVSYNYIYIYIYIYISNHTNLYIMPFFQQLPLGKASLPLHVDIFHIYIIPNVHNMLFMCSYLNVLSYSVICNLKSQQKLNRFCRVHWMLDRWTLPSQWHQKLRLDLSEWHVCTSAVHSPQGIQWKTT